MKSTEEEGEEEGKEEEEETRGMNALGARGSREAALCEALMRSRLGQKIATRELRECKPPRDTRSGINE